MKRFLCLAVLMLFLGFSALAAYVNESATLNEDYILVYNTTVTKTAVSAIPAENASIDRSNSAAHTDIHTEISDIEEINGEIFYRTEYIDEPVEIDGEAATLFSDLSFKNNLSVGQTRTFKVSNQYLQKYEAIGATFVYSSDYCDVFVETAYWNSGITIEKAKAVADEFNDRIRPCMIADFGDYIGYQKNGKIVIFMVDIRDAYYYGNGNSYVGGYFSSADLFDTASKGSGNLMPMINIDIKPLMGNSGEYDVSKAYSTIAHEFQHLVNYSDYYYNYTTQGSNENWMNEMFSMCAEHILYGTLKNRVNYYNGAYTNGNVISGSDGKPINTYVKSGSILNYAKYTDNNNDIVANYSIPYLFGQYIKNQTKDYSGGGNAIFRTIMESNNTGCTAITEAMRKIGYPVTSFSKLNENFRIAATLRNYRGLYSFNDDYFTAYLKPLIYEPTGEALSLRGTEAVVMQSSAAYTVPTHGADIKFVGFQASNPAYEEKIFANVTGVREENGKKIVSVNAVNNYSDKNYDAVNIIVAAYSQDGKLLDVKTQTDFLCKGEDLNYEFEMEYDDAEELRVFILRKADLPKPMCAYARHIF